MALLRVQVPTTEHSAGVVEYTGDVSACVDAETQTLYVACDAMILAEFPAGRWTDWTLTPDAPEA